MKDTPNAAPMPRDNRHKLKQMRARIAAAAARLMAEDGVSDYATAKRKAARQLGADSTHALPDNAEVEAALKQHQALYQGEEQTDRVAALREVALDAMQALESFRPYLVGAVLSGTAGKYADIDMQLYTDEGKNVELFLLNRGIAYDVENERRRVGDRLHDVAVLSLEWDGAPLRLAVYPANAERIAQRSASGDRLLERANLAAVRALVQATWQTPPGGAGA